MATQIPFSDPGVAGFQSSGDYAGVELLYGDTPQMVTQSYPVDDATAALPIYSVVGFDAQGEIVPALLGTTAAIGITASLIGAAAAGRKVSVYRAGHFNANALNWPASYDTLAKRLAAFNGAPAPTNILLDVNPNDPTFV
jgi:hypothetical protein